jgi:hypothetical protein
MSEDNIASTQLDHVNQRKIQLNDTEGFSVNTKTYTSQYLNLQAKNIHMEFNQLSEMTSINLALQNPYTTLAVSNRLVSFPTYQPAKKVKKKPIVELYVHTVIYIFIIPC